MHNRASDVSRRSAETCRGAFSRRHFLASAALPALLPAAQPAPAAGPAAPVAIARCPDYGPPLHAALKTLFDQLGGLGRLVKGKTVALKINMTGSARQRLGAVPTELTTYTHPAVIGVTARLMGEAGARRVRIVEGCFSCSDPLEEFMIDTGWDPAPLLAAAPNVDMENTNLLSKGRKYARFMTPKGGHIFPGFDMNHSYEECDVLVSIAKMKEHATCGITLAMKNMFGATPLTIYGDNAGKDEPDENGAIGGRGTIMHAGARGPAKSAPQERDPKSPRADTYRMPRIVADIAAARPIHLSIIDAIDTMAGGEGPWIRGCRHIHPGLLVAGLNPLCTDAVGAALMGFDPMAERGKAPFERCDNSLRLAEELGVGTRDLTRIEVIGVPIEQAVFRFRA